MATCLALPKGASQEAPRCGRASAGRYAVGCIHEHVTTVPLCAGHVLGVAGGDGWCIDCRYHPDEPHECKMAAVPVGGDTKGA